MGKKLAKFISLIFDPALLAIIIVVVAILDSPMTKIEMLSWILGVMLLNCLIPFLFLVYFTKKGFVFDDDLKNEQVHRQRIWIFLVFLVVVTLEFLILLCTKQYQPLMAVFSGGLISIALALIITYFWKISLHSSMVTFFVAMIIYIFGWDYAYAALVIPFVFWSRLILKRHTFLQLTAGSLLAVLVVVLTWYVYKSL